MLVFLNFRGSAAKDSISAAYQTLGSQLRPVPPGTVAPNRSIFTIQPTPEAPQPTAPQPHPVQPPPYPYAAEPAAAATTSFSRQQEVMSVGANATQTITTETERQDLGGVTLTKVTRQVVLDTSGDGGAPWLPSTQEPAKRDNDATVQTATIFHVPKIKAQALRWQPGDNSSQAADRIVVNKPVTFDVTPFGAKVEEAPRVRAFAGVEAPPREEDAKFRVPKTTAKPWIWQPSYVPDLPVREASPTLAFQVLEGSAGVAPPPYDSHQASKEEERSRGGLGRGGLGGGGRGGGGSSDDPALSPDLIRVLTTEAQEDDYWAEIMRNSKSLIISIHCTCAHTQIT